MTLRFGMSRPTLTLLAVLIPLVYAVCMASRSTLDRRNMPLV